MPINPDLPHYQPSATINCLVQAMRTPDPIIARNLFLEARARVLQGAVYLGAWTKNDRVACESHKLTLRETNRLYQDYDRIAFEAQRLRDMADKADPKAAAAAVREAATHADLHKGRNNPVTANREDYTPEAEAAAAPRVSIPRPDDYRPQDHMARSYEPEGYEGTEYGAEFGNLGTEHETLKAVSRFFKELNTWEIPPRLRNDPEKLEKRAVELTEDLVQGIPQQVLDGVADGAIPATPEGVAVPSVGRDFLSPLPPEEGGREAAGRWPEPADLHPLNFGTVRGGDTSIPATPEGVAVPSVGRDFLSPLPPEEGGREAAGRWNGAPPTADAPPPEPFHLTAARLDRSDSVTSMEYWSPELVTGPDPFDADHRERAERNRREQEGNH